MKGHALKTFAALFFFILLLTSCSAPPAPQPFGPLPSARQLAWHDLEYYAFLHFNMNTFTDREWGYGDELPALFNPTEFDADQIAATLKEVGMKALILTAKHHDGFCLWPSQFTEHSVKNSPWREGKGDVVRELAEACQRHGLKFGVYLSPWDRNHKDYGAPQYVAYYRNQLRELLTSYGEIFEVWHDGANGGDGYYGGARESRFIDKKTYYDWPATWALVRELQPNAVIFSDVGPDLRWVGNENGYAGETCWATYSPVGEDGGEPAPGDTRYREGIEGHRAGKQWLPAECDVSIRPGWFYHAAQDSLVKSAEALFELYFKSVGRGASLLLNLPPDRRGRIHENDERVLRGLKRMLDETFAVNFARGAEASASHVRGNSSRYGPGNAIDDDNETYWTTDDAISEASLTIELKTPQEFDCVMLQEHIALGQRVEAFALEAWKDNEWQIIAEGTSIGHQRLLRFPAMKTDKVRLNIAKASACPVIANVGLYKIAQP